MLFGSSTRDRHTRCIYRRTFSADEITRKASDVAENLQLYRVVWFFHVRSSCMTIHISVDIQRITLNASCMTTSGGRTKQLDIFCHITGFTGDFLSFIVVELIWFFHGALQVLTLVILLPTCIVVNMCASESRIAVKFTVIGQDALSAVSTISKVFRWRNFCHSGIVHMYSINKKFW